MYNDFSLGVIVGACGFMFLCVIAYAIICGIAYLQDWRRRRLYESLKASALECDNG